ncbi:LysR family transcriptional regulator [Pseudoroseicyclus tamaricis]|uniref:LysR family transcriptional regulator n=1 Tax=Pseudoroseicyclus tamaricis TaxID=2705421 RepID=A0A6B2JW98_9RHOB|nr:LysR family transcriptional regulator [Pseudoroseicyclus tamaricis]NDV02390.1 LysR family transcriptional regulator [Pseudoroseicyclus tamaricis]
MSNLTTGLRPGTASSVDIKFRQLEIFYGVVVAGTITRASQRIGLSQPSISQQLAKLEETLGARLIERNRTGTVALTPAGEFWFRHAEDMLREMQSVLREHEQRFRNGSVVLRMGITPAMRGTFVMAAAKIAMRETDFAKFEVVYDLNSSALFEQLRMHKVNVAILASEVLGAEASSFAVDQLYEDHIALAVPATVSEDDLRYAFSPGAEPDRIRPELLRYVEIDGSVPTRAPSDEWYRTHLPAAMGSFGAPSFTVAASFVAEGLATAHLPISTAAHLPATMRQQMRLYVLPGMSRKVVIAMRKHLLTHGTYARIFRGIVDFCQTELSRTMAETGAAPVCPLIDGGAAGAASHAAE